MTAKPGPVYHLPPVCPVGGCGGSMDWNTGVPDWYASCDRCGCEMTFQIDPGPEDEEDEEDDGVT